MKKKKQDTSASSSQPPAAEAGTKAAGTEAQSRKEEGTEAAGTKAQSRKALCISEEQMELKQATTREAAIAQVTALLGATFEKAYAHFQTAFLDFVGENPDAPGKKFKFPIGITIKLSPMDGDVAVQSKLSFGSRRTFNTEARAASQKQDDLFEHGGQDARAPKKEVAA